MNLRYFLSLTILFMGGTFSFSEESVTLEPLIDEALQRNPEMRVFQADLVSAQGEVISAKAWENPDLSLSPGFRHISESGESNGAFRGEAELTQLLEFPGKREIRKAIAQKNAVVKQMALDGFRYQLCVNIRKIFYQLLLNREIEALRQEQVKSAQAFAHGAHKRMESGYASDFEVIKAEADLINARKLLKEARTETTQSRIELNSWVGRSPLSPLEIQGNFEADLLVAPKNRYLAQAMTHNPSVLIKQIELDKASLSLKAARLGRLPDFSMGSSIEYTRDEQVYGFGVSLPLPLWNQNQGEILQSMGEEAKAEAELHNLHVEITKAVTIALEKLRSVQDQLRLYTPEFNERLKSIMISSEKSYSQSATTLLIYLDTKQTYFDTLTEYYRTTAEFVEARAELESAVGVPIDLQEDFNEGENDENIS